MYQFSIENFADWRLKARQLLSAYILPSEVIWQTSVTSQKDLFAEKGSFDLSHIPKKDFFIPKAFLDLAKVVACHRHDDKWSLLYLTLWRITHGEKYLLAVTSDVTVNRLMLYQKAVLRDAHKMKAFVRFRCYQDEGEEYYIAWHQPDHLIVKIIAPFFKKRFQVMKWTIMTPDETVSWDGEELIFSEGVPSSAHIEDKMEDLWCTYYRAIFNPARLKLKAMRNEMPVRYWHTMPETKIISQLIQEAPARVLKMLDEQKNLQQSAKDFFEDAMNLDELKSAAANCKACPLHTCARQTVFGKGPSQAELMIVGEQPGLQEDIQGEPFVGPAGQLLRELMEEVEIDMEDIYITNTVKHFKNINVRGKQLHRSPDIHEITACKPWLEKEIQLVNPKIILCLGNTAAKTVIMPSFTMNKSHGKFFNYQNRQVIGSFHPSAILRMSDVHKREAMYAILKTDLKSSIEGTFTRSRDK